jgi:type I restriction enzyme S subunit
LKEGVQHQENKSCPSSEYPNHWKLLKLRHAGSCANGINISGDAFGSGTPFISYGDVYKNAQIPDTILGLVECSAEDKKRYSIKRGDVLFTRTSENIEDIGTASTCMTDVPDGVYAGFLIRFRPNPNVLLPEYSKFLFRNSTVRSFFSKEVMLVTRASLSQNLLKNLPLALPPLNEQIGLAKILLDIEASHVELTSKIKATILSLREYKSSIITAAVTGQIDVKSYGKSGAVDRHLDHLQDEGRA